MANDNNLAEGVGQAGQFKDVTEKYDAQAGKYADNVRRDGTLTTVNSEPAAPNPSPFRVGPT